MKTLSRIAVLPLRGRQRLNTVSIFKIIVKKAIVVVARFGFFSAVELAVTDALNLLIIHLQFRSENSSSAVFRFGIWSAYIAGVDMSVSKENDVEDQLH